MVEAGVGVAGVVPEEGVDADLSVCIHTILFIFSLLLYLLLFVLILNYT